MICEYFKTKLAHKHENCENRNENCSENYNENCSENQENRWFSQKSLEMEGHLPGMVTLMFSLFSTGASIFLCLPHGYKIHFHGFHIDWKTWNNANTFSSRGILNILKKSGHFAQILER